MRKLLLVLVLLVLCYYAFLNRDRIFVRDPLGSVTRNDVKESGAQVFINYDNDVLLENDNTPMYLHILQHGQPVGSPDSLKCIHYLVCFTNGYPAPQAAAVPGARLESMTNKQVRFRDGNGREAVVNLR